VQASGSAVAAGIATQRAMRLGGNRAFGTGIRPSAATAAQFRPWCESALPMPGTRRSHVCPPPVEHLLGAYGLGTGPAAGRLAGLRSLFAVSQGP